MPVHSGINATPEVHVLWSASEGQVVNAGVFVFALFCFWLLFPVAWALYRYLATANVDRTIGLWELSSGRLLGVCGGSKQAVHSVVFSPDDQTLVSGGTDGTLRFWNVQTRQELLTFSQPGLHPAELFFSPDGLTLASMSNSSFSDNNSQFPLLQAASWTEVEGTKMTAGPSKPATREPVR